MTGVIETDSLTRSFGDRLAVDRLDLRAEAGDIFGLLGPNGAGKTTTIRMLTTLLTPSSGAARICGFDVSREPGAVRRRIGYVMQSVPWQVNRLLRAREIVEIEAALHHVPQRVRRERVDEALDLLGLLPHADRLIGEFSGGMHKRLDLACGLLHRPELLVLDEPTLGLDVQSRHRIWDYILGLRDEGVTVLLATNYLDEADRLCNRLTIMDNGRSVVSGSPVELKHAVAADVIQVATSSPERLRDAIAHEPWVKNTILTDSNEVHIYVKDASQALPAVMSLSLANDLGLERVTYTQPSLDDVFLLHTGRELRDLEVGA
ncbi:MAG: ATP-binding cassette domain-containing protein [Actinobacteria bacterium]|nr:ATP-binding cassette domain-containing protein [Actinomycetota bacterium]